MSLSETYVSNHATSYLSGLPYTKSHIRKIRNKSNFVTDFNFNSSHGNNESYVISAFFLNFSRRGTKVIDYQFLHGRTIAVHSKWQPTLTKFSKNLYWIKSEKLKSRMKTKRMLRLFLVFLLLNVNYAYWGRENDAKIW